MLMSLQVILGSMYSGKTTALIEKVLALRALGLKCLIVNHTNDSRVEGPAIQTHDGQTVTAMKTDDVLLLHTLGYDAIAIDEGQFFPHLKMAVLNMVEKKGQHVIVAGLSGDSWRRPFGEMLELVPVADNVQWLRADCVKCDSKASFTKRISDETEKVSVNSEYIALCRACYVKK
jgi:thymidine kinase